MKVHAQTVRDRTTENLCCYHCTAPAVKVAGYGGLEVGLCGGHADAPPVLSLETCCTPRCRSFVEEAIACQDCGKTYRKCAAHGGRAAAARSLKSHRGLYHPKAQG